MLIIFLFQDDFDKCPDLCVEIHQGQDIALKVSKAKELKAILLRAPLDGDILVSNGSIESVCKLLALTKNQQVQEILLLAMQEVVSQSEK